MSIGGRIKLARKANAMSLRALAGKIDISPMAISKYERGENNPSSGVLLRLAKALDVKVEYFFRPPPEAVSLTLFRKHSSLGKTALDSIKARIQEWLERYLEIELFFENGFNSFNSLHKFPVSSLEDVENIANEVRSLWDLGLDPIDDLIDVLESKGIKIGLIDCGDGFDGCTFMNNGIPVIGVRKDIPGDRQRLNIAHELGHILLNVPEEKLVEKAAFRFAAAFLFPKDIAFQELGKHRTRLGIDELYLLKHKYGISMQAIIYRAKDLGIIKEGYFKKLFISFSKQGFRIAEPGDEFPPEKPKRMKHLLLRLLAEEIITQSKAQELYGGRIFELGGLITV